VGGAAAVKNGVRDGVRVERAAASALVDVMISRPSAGRAFFRLLRARAPQKAECGLVRSPYKFRPADPTTNSPRLPDLTASTAPVLPVGRSQHPPSLHQSHSLSHHDHLQGESAHCSAASSDIPRLPLAAPNSSPDDPTFPPAGMRLTFP